MFRAIQTLVISAVTAFACAPYGGDAEEQVGLVEEALSEEGLSAGEVRTETFSIPGNASWIGTYKIYLPAGYSESAQTYPWMMFFVGSGEQTGNIDAHGPLAVIRKNGNQAPDGFGMENMIFVVGTQPYDRGNNTSMAAADALYREVVANYGVDVNRLSVTGLSMGANGVHEFVKRYPERVSSAIVVAGANSARRISDAQACLNYGGPNGVPLWLFHGTVDRPGWDISPENTTRLYEVVKACEAPPAVAPRYSLVVGRGHTGTFWNEIYSNSGAATWALEGPGLDGLNSGGVVSIYDWAQQHGEEAEEVTYRNVALGAAATASSVYQSYTPDKAVDGDAVNMSSRWLSVVNDPAKSLTIDLGGTYTLSRAVLKTGYGGSYAVANFHLLACVQGTCQPIPGASVANNPRHQVENTLTFSSPVEASSVRFESTDTDHVRIRELELWGH